ncbi:MAG TPA: hypothetical protein VGE79_11965 [Niastella sp.]
MGPTPLFKWLATQMLIMKEKALAFVSGSLLTVINSMGEEVFKTLFFGLLGGIAGIAGKELYSLIKKRILLWLRQK